MANNFKIKHNRSKHVMEISTLDETHKKFMSTFQNRRDLLPKKKKRVTYLKSQLEKIENTNGSKYTTDDIKKRAELKIEIYNLENEINDIENNLSELDYYFKTEDLIMDYYEIVDTDDNLLYTNHPELSEAKINSNNSDNGENEIDKLDILNMRNKENKKVKRTTKRRKKGLINEGRSDILSFFSSEPTLTPSMNTSTETEQQPQNSSENDMETEMDDDDYLGNTECEKLENNLSDDSPIKIVKNKSELLDQYMTFINRDWVSEKNRINDIIRHCHKCGIEKTLIHSESIFVCQKCGEFEVVIIDSEKPNYKEAVIDTKPGYIWVAKKVDMKSILPVQ